MCKFSTPCKCPKSIHFCYTINNYDKIPDILFTKKPFEINYLLQGFEEAPTTKTKYIQGYAQFRTPKKLCTALNVLSKKNKDYLDKITIFICKGSDVDNFNYCTKSKFTQLGTRKEIKSLFPQHNCHLSLELTQNYFQDLFLNFIYRNFENSVPKIYLDEAEIILDIGFYLELLEQFQQWLGLDEMCEREICNKKFIENFIIQNIQESYPKTPENINL